MNNYVNGKEPIPENIEVPFTMELTFPVKYNDEEVKEICFNRRSQAGDFKGLSRNLESSECIKLISRLTGNPGKLIERLDGIDFIRANEVITHFLASSPEGGEE